MGLSVKQKQEIIDSMCLGDKLVDIMDKGESGIHGKHLGATGSSTICEVDGVKYKLLRNVDVGNPLWTVMSLKSWVIVKCKDDLALICLKLSDFQ